MPLILLYIQYSFNAQHVSAVNTTIFRSLRLTGCYFMGGIWFGVCWRSVSVWLWRCGVFMQSEALNEYWINNKISGIKLVFSLLNYKDDARSHKHKMHKFLFYKSLLHASTCFEHYVLIIRRSKLYYTASGISQSAHGTATYRCDDTRCCIIQFLPHDDEHTVLETCRGM